MKKDLHPTDYRLVVFQDTSSDFSFLTRSTVAATETIKWEDGNEYPLIKVHVSSASHPFFTGEEKIVDIEGRVDRFKSRTAAAAKKREEALARNKKPAAKKATAKKEVTEASPEAPVKKKVTKKPAEKKAAPKTQDKEVTETPKETTTEAEK